MFPFLNGVCEMGKEDTAGKVNQTKSALHCNSATVKVKT